MVSGVPRETTVSIQGLVTTPNEYGVYPEGSAREIRNWLARSANQWVCARDTEFVFQGGLTNNLIYRIFGTAPGAFVTIQVNPATGYVSPWLMYLNGDPATAFSLTLPLSSTALFNPNGYLTPLIARSRIFLNSQQGVIVCDKVAPATAGERVFRTAGLTQPMLGNIISNGPGTTLPDDVLVTYAVVGRRKSADGYVLISPPTPGVVIGSQSGDWTPTVQVFFDTPIYKAGDVIELYRSAGILDPTGFADTGTSMRMVTSKVLSAADITAGNIVLVDKQLMTAPLYETTGTEIYTSPYQEGSVGANLGPPICKAMSSWGIYTFYGNITDDPTWTYDVPGGVFSTYETAADNDFTRRFGIGERVVTGTRTAGSPVITAVSATHMLGIVPGQQASGAPGFPVGTKVVSVGVSSITMSANTNSPGTGVQTELRDIFEINGRQIAVTGLYNLTIEAMLSTSPRVAAFPSSTIGSQDYDTGTTIVFRPAIPGASSTITIRGTNGQNYSPPIPDIAATVQTITQTEVPNLLRWSKPNQPEAVPTPNEAFVGNGKIIRMLPTTDALIILCTDGAYRLTGEAGVWRTDLVDPTFVPCAPDACCVLNDVVYAYTGRGFCSLSGVTTSLISRGVIDAQFPGRQFEEIRRIHMYADTSTEEIITLIQDPVSLDNSSTIYIYSTLYKQWTIFDPPFDTFTAIGTFYPSASGGVPYVLLGEWGGTGFAPVVSTWRPDSGQILDLPELRLQPFYAGDPALVKQWIDATWILNSGSSAVVRQEVSNGNSSGQDNIRSNTNDSRATLGIDISSAISPVLQLSGFVVTFNLDPIPVLKGVSVRYVPLTTQQKVR